MWATLDLSSNETDDGCSNEDVSKARAHTFGVLGSNFAVENTSSIKLVSGQVGEGMRVQHCLVCLHAHVCVLMFLSVCAMRSPPVALHILQTAELLQEGIRDEVSRQGCKHASGCDF